MSVWSSTCRCGAIEIEVSAPPIAQFYCHCDDCQAMHGAAYVSESVYPASAVNVRKGEPTMWMLERNPRFFCSTCGTRLFIEVAGRDMRGVNGYMLSQGAFEPKFHVNCAYAVRPVVDGLPHFKKMPKAFGGSDEKVDW